MSQHAVTTTAWITEAGQTATPELCHTLDLMQRFEDDVECAGLVGEKRNAKIILHAGASARLALPLNVTVQGPSAVGKNHLIGTVARFFPPDHVKTMTGMSPKVLMHAAEDEFEHKAVFIAEHEGVAGADYPLRTMQSEREITWEYVESSKDGIRKKSRTVRGPAAFIQATTRSILHPENETRLLFVQMDESQELTREILRYQAWEAAMGNSLVAESIFQPWHELIRNLKHTKVRIPFASKLAFYFPSNRIRSRRDFPKLLGLIETSAFLHQHQRTIEDENVIANCQDYQIAKELFEHCYSVGPDKAVRELLQAAQAVELSDGDFTVSDLMAELAWGKTKTYEVLGRAEEHGCIAPRKERGRYKFLRDNPDPQLNLPESISDDL